MEEKRGGNSKKRVLRGVGGTFNLRLSLPLLARKSCVCGTTKRARIPLKLQSKIALLYLVDSLAPCGSWGRELGGVWWLVVEKYRGKRCATVLDFFLSFLSLWLQRWTFFVPIRRNEGISGKRGWEDFFSSFSSKFVFKNYSSLGWMLWWSLTLVLSFFLFSFECWKLIVLRQSNFQTIFPCEFLTGYPCTFIVVVLWSIFVSCFNIFYKRFRLNFTSLFVWNERSIGRIIKDLSLIFR